MTLWQDLLEQMEAAVATSSGDPDVGHVDADDLLVAALRLAVEEPPSRGVVVALTALYDDVRKWYA